MKIEGKWKQVNTVGTFLDLILQSDISTTDNTSHLYFRGESKYHDTIVPSIYLDEKLTLEGSEYYYRNLISQIGCKDYSDSSSLFRQLSEFQHYGAKTRILDITSNPLIALFFAVEKYYGEKAPGLKRGEKDVLYPCTPGFIYIYKTSIKEEKYDTGHTVAIKSSLNLMSPEITNSFLSVCEELRNKHHDWEIFRHLNIHSIEESYHHIESARYNFSRREYCTIARFMDQLNQKARTTDKLIYPFKIFEDLNASHIVIPSKCTDRIKQQQGAFIFPKHVNSTGKDIEQIKIEIDESISTLSGSIKTTKPQKEISVIKIPGLLKPKIKKELAQIGITEGFVYPDIEHRSNALLNNLR